MVLILHIIIALSSIVYTGYVLLKPTKRKINFSYSLVAATITTGTYLVILMPSHMVSACMSGLIYLAFVSVGLIFANKRLAVEHK